MQIIKSAIQDRQRLQFIYKGHIRIIEPHAYGATKKGSDVLHAYQVAVGHSSTHGQNSWHLFTVSKMQNVILHNTCFENAAPGYYSATITLSGQGQLACPVDPVNSCPCYLALGQGWNLFGTANWCRY